MNLFNVRHARTRPRHWYLLVVSGPGGVVGVLFIISLIGFWFTRDNISVGTRTKISRLPVLPATKAFVTNHVGDFGFMLGVILMMFWTVGSLSFDTVFGKTLQQ